MDSCLTKFSGKSRPRTLIYREEPSIENPNLDFTHNSSTVNNTTDLDSNRNSRAPFIVFYPFVCTNINVHGLYNTSTDEVDQIMSSGQARRRCLLPPSRRKPPMCFMCFFYTRYVSRYYTGIPNSSETSLHMMPRVLIYFSAGHIRFELVEVFPSSNGNLTLPHRPRSLTQAAILVLFQVLCHFFPSSPSSCFSPKTTFPAPNLHASPLKSDCKQCPSLSQAFIQSSAEWIFGTVTLFDMLSQLSKLSGIISQTRSANNSEYRTGA